MHINYHPTGHALPSSLTFQNYSDPMKSSSSTHGAVVQDPKNIQESLNEEYDGDDEYE
uniref:Uncharacterized protein n=1 Tax=Meloidogyne enterolobii TaxID=390850 RepID=A0A6V7YD01_MELEN|nr:unnamed protein product [Meloidogyne enterolobii]